MSANWTKIDRTEADKLRAKVVLPAGANCHCGLEFIPRWKPIPNTERPVGGHVNTERQTASQDYVCPVGHVLTIRYPA